MKFKIKNTVRRLGVIMFIMALIISSTGFVSWANYSIDDKVVVGNGHLLEEDFQNDFISNNNLERIKSDNVLKIEELTKDSIINSDIATASNVFTYDTIVTVTTEDELKKEIAIAAEGATIQLANNIYLNETIHLYKSINIVSAENKMYTIYAPENKRHFYIEGDNVEVKFNVLLNGNEIGGGIENHADYLLLQGVNIYNCTNFGNGGGIYTAGDLTILFATFRYNSANNGSAIYAKNANISMYNMSFSYNQSVNNGAIYCENGTLSINGESFFSGNKALNGGGVYGYNCEMNFDGTFFTDNQVDENGGAIYGYGCKIDVCCGNFIFNYANNKGGAIYVNDIESLAIQGASIFLENVVPIMDVLLSEYYQVLHREMIGLSVYWDTDSNYLYNNVDVSSEKFFDGSEVYTVTIITQYLDGMKENESNSYQVIAGESFEQSYDALEGYTFIGMSVRSYPYIDGDLQMVYIDEVKEDYEIIINLDKAEYNVIIVVQYPEGTIESQVNPYSILYGDSFLESFEVESGYRIVAIQAEKGVDVDFQSKVVEIEAVKKDMFVTIICR